MLVDAGVDVFGPQATSSYQVRAVLVRSIRRFGVPCAPNEAADIAGKWRSHLRRFEKVASGGATAAEFKVKTERDRASRNNPFGKCTQKKSVSFDTRRRPISSRSGGKPDRRQHDSFSSRSRGTS